METLENTLKTIAYIIAGLFGLSLLQSIAGPTDTNASNTGNLDKAKLQALASASEHIKSTLALIDLERSNDAANPNSLQKQKNDEIAAKTNHLNTATLVLSNLPVKGEINLTSAFGYRTDPFLKKRRFHNGIDIGLKSGTKIMATGSGIVSKSGYNHNLGYYIVISHQQNYESIYGHLSRIGVRAGQAVTAGQIIGYSGNSGRSTGPHLHYQVNHKGKPVDPIGVHRSQNAIAG